MSSFLKFLNCLLLPLLTIILLIWPIIPANSAFAVTQIITQPSMETPSDINVSTIMDNVTKNLWAVFGGIALILFIYAGLMFLTAEGDPAKLTTARHAFLWGVVGVAIMILAWSISGLVSGILGISHP